MPQISQLAATYLSQIFWLVVTFGLVFLVVGRGMLPRVQSTIETRDRRIAEDLAAAAAARENADKAEEDWRVRENALRERAQGVVSEARARAGKASEETLAAAGREQAERTAASEAGIRASTDRALGEIEAVAAEAAQDIVSRIAGVQVSADDARAAVNRVMTHA